MTHLTPLQQQAVDFQDNLLLTACPGSGKTRTLIAKLVAEIEGVRDTPKSICCITYTNTAVQEMEHRAGELLQAGDDRFFHVSTIHSFCLHFVLRPFGWLRPELGGARKVLTRDNPDFEAICRYAAEQVNLLILTARDYEAFENLSVNAHGQIVGMAADNVPVSNAAPHYWRRCAELGYIDFGNILYGSYCLLRDFPRIARSLCAKFPWFLIDEFQDTTELQIEVLRILHGTERSKFFMVGDFAQSIFGFTGAQPELVEPFAAHINAKRDLALNENWRSSARVVAHAERLIPRVPAMISVGPDRDYPVEPFLVRGTSAFEAVTEHFLPLLLDRQIPLGNAAILAKDWASLYNLSRMLREFGTAIVGPGARPYRRSRLFAQLAEQLCGAVTDPQADTARQLERALFHTIQDATGEPHFDVFTFNGRRAVVCLVNAAREVAQRGGAAIPWLDEMSTRTADILERFGYVDREQGGLFFASAQEMKADMARQEIDLANLGIDDLGLFASPHRALRLTTIHQAKGREYEAVALIGLRQGAFPHFRATDIQAEKRQLYVGVTRAQKILMYVAERDNWGNPPSPFLGPECLNVI
jgi:DNA helicase II / ATP-dependent DNA helicase PcrA